MTEHCTYTGNGWRCVSGPFDHVHDMSRTDCPSWSSHHEYVPEAPHEHVFDRCVCGAREEGTE